ncbi:MAG: 16S rRNA (cytidine(1402)-2'-O)-methyltransferase [Gemmatimonadota bacterium]
MSDREEWGTCYVVGTPIGNLGDITDRAIATLRTVGVCYAEDTRRTRRLFAKFGIDAPLRSMHAHNEMERTAEIIDRLERGESVALVSDAGTPTVSDPGRRVVAAVLDRGGTVTPIPGASAVPTALSASGLPADRCFFAGFAPRKGTARGEWFADVTGSRATVVMFEAPGRLRSLLATLEKKGLGARRAVVCRELTKLHEEILSGTIDELATVYARRTVKGEVTVVMAGRPTQAEGADVLAVADAAGEVVKEMLEAGEGRRRIAEELKQRFGLTRNDAYRMSLELPEAGADD